MTTQRYSGRVIQKADKLGVSGLTVEAYASRGDGTHTIASTVTESRGRFILEVSAAALRSAFGSDVPPLDLRVRDKGEVYRSTSGATRWDARRSGSGTIEIDKAVAYPAAVGQRWFVEGTVSNPDGTTPPGITVEVWGQQIGRFGVEEESLGSTSLSASGEFHVAFIEGPTTRRIRVAARDGSGEVASRQLDTPTPRTRVHLIVGAPNIARDRGLTDHARVRSRIDPLLADVGASLDALTSDQISLLAAQARVPRASVERAVNAKKLSSTHTSLSAEHFFGLLGDGVTPTSQGVFQHRIPTLLGRLQQAVASRVVSPAITANTTTLRAALEAAALQALRTPVAGTLPIGVAVDTCPGLSTTTNPTDADLFLTLLINHTGRAKAFWDAVDVSSLSGTAKTRLRFTMEACRLSGSFQPVVEALHARIAASTLSDDPKALASYTTGDWRALINSIASGPRYPDDTPGADDTEKRDNYAKTVAERVEARFRTAVIRSRVASAEPSSTLSTFFDDNADFDFETQRVGSYLKAASDPFSGVPLGERPALEARLYDIERIFRVTDRWEDTDRAIAAGYTSASAIDEAGRETFVADMKAGTSDPREQAAREARARDSFDKACWAMGAATALKVAYDSTANKLKTAVTPDKFTFNPEAELDPAIADWKTLFGSGDACACEHCRSVLGPAAYLADTLQLLKRVPAAPTGTARDVVFERRPDLPLLALSCANTDTALPYVDLVNEILEVRTAVSTWPTSPTPVDTSLTTADLLAQPEIIYPTEHIAAYTTLEGAIYPFHLPFHLWQEEARIYLEHLGIRRAELLEIFAPASGADPRDLTLERLGTTGRQLDIITGPPSEPTAPQPYEYWDIAQAHWPTHPSYGLQRARVFLEKTKLSFDELRELLATDYCLTNLIKLEEDAPCDVDQLDIQGLDGPSETHRQFLHRFLRLRLVLGWSLTDTGRAHTALGSFDAAAIQSLAGIRELSRIYAKLSPSELLAWYADVDRHNTWNPSLFERVFLNNRIIAPSNQAFQTVFSNGTPTEDIGSVRAGLLAALRLSDRDLALLVDVTAAEQALAFVPIVASTETVTLARLSRLYRVASFARANKTKIKDFLLLRELSGLNVLTGDAGAPASPDGALAFRMVAERAAAIDLSLEELHYLIRHVAPEGSKLLLDPVEDIAAWREELGALVTAALEQPVVEVTDDVTGTTALALALDVLVNPGLLQALVNDPTQMSSPEAEVFIIDTLAPILGGAAAADAAVDFLVNGITAEVPEERRSARYGYLASRFQRYLDARTTVINWFAEKLGVELDVAQRLLGDRILTWSGEPAVLAFLPGTATQVQQEDLIVRAHKAFLFAKKLELTAAELDAIYPPTWTEPSALPTASLPAIDWMAVPLVRPAAAHATATERLRFELLLQAGELAKLRDRWPTGSATLFDVFSLAAAPPGTGVYDRIAACTGWSRSEVEQVATELGLSATNFTHAVPLLRVERALAAVRRLGVPAAMAIGWLKVDQLSLPLSFSSVGPNALTVAREIREAAGAKHEDEAWAGVARPLRNALREKQRDALVGHLLKKLGLSGPDALYEHLLVDVQMDPCMLTSRLVLAHGSVQLFVQRIQLNLEQASGLSPNDQLAAQWLWMKNYRVWEANRKVFLWPENWIEPELRDDKTPLFVELERSLLSGPIDNGSAEEAYRTYLDGLADLSNLQIVAVHVHKDENPNIPQASAHTIVHVFGRTRKSHKYYYRRRELGRWYAWEKLDLDIQGDHLMPFTFGGRLFLSWAIFEDVERKKDAAPADDQSSQPTIGEQIEDLQQARAALDAQDPEELKQMTVIDIEILALQLELQKQNAAPSDLSTAVPPEVEARVRLAVSELRHTGWTPALESEAYTLGASPPRSWVSFLTDVGPSVVTTRMLFLNADVARFSFYPGTNVHRGNVDYPLVANPEIYQSETLTAAPGPGAPQYQVTLPQPFPLFNGWLFQGFQINTSQDHLSLFLVESGTPTPSAKILSELDSPTVIQAHRVLEPAGERPFLIMQDQLRTFTLDLRNVTPPPGFPLPPALIDLATSEPPIEAGDRVYRFDLFYHPYVNWFRHAVASGGLDALLRPVEQSGKGLQYVDHDLEGLGVYATTENFDDSLPLKEYVDFRHSSAYGVYNWELFFHIPFYIAISLTREGRYEEAQRWFHTIFDPTDGSSGPTPARFWKLKPFAENEDLTEIQNQLGNLTQSTYAVQILQLTTGNFSLPAALDVAYQISQWRFDPFDPHMLARLRPVAYQKAVVMRYIDNLVQWADSLFAQDTMESINEATQLYVFALNILGPKPTLIPAPTPVPVMSYGELDAASAFDVFANALVGAEVIAPPIPKDATFKCNGKQPPPKILWGSPYFCVPPNEKLLGYWDTIADRLFKIRNCQNIEGVVRVLPLYQPPIDPALLVRAAALGIPFSDVVSDLNVAAPPHRYGVLYAKAVELASSVASLGGTYLSVLEKGDAEALANLRQEHEIATQESVLETRLAQAKEARESLRATERSLALAQERFEYYSTRELVSSGELQTLTLRGQAVGATVTASSLRSAAAQAGHIPNFTSGGAGASSPVAVFTYGGSNVVNALQGSASAQDAIAAAKSGRADTVGTMAGYLRRHQDWTHQAKLASLEIVQIERQIEAARIRVEIAEHEASVVRQQIAQAKQIERFLLRKFTNADLYGWMKGQLASVYYQAYKLAYEAAKRAQKAYEYERGDAPGAAAFIKPGSWDNLKKGLLAGERLLQDLRRLDAAYTSQNKRELELVKTVSLVEHDPDQLVRLRESGVAELSLTEDDYDRDFDSHYLRRLKAASVTVPCTTGPYQGVLGTLTLFHGATRRTKDGTEAVHFGAIQSIATSQGQSDAGVFELSFKDERLLPFEGAGAHAAPDALGKQWSFNLSGGNRFPYDSIDDLVLELRYTARGGRTWEAPNEFARTRRRLVRVRREHPDAWRAFKQGGANIAIPLPLSSWTLGRNEESPKVQSVTIYGWWSGSVLPTMTLASPSGAVSLSSGSTTYGNELQWRSTSSQLNMNLADEDSSLFTTNRAA